jgi:hypothetical protein
MSLESALRVEYFNLGVCCADRHVSRGWVKAELETHLSGSPERVQNLVATLFGKLIDTNHVGFVSDSD